MKMKKHLKTAVFIALILCLSFFIFLTIKQNRQISQLKGSMTTLLEGERIDYFDLLGTDNQTINASALNDGQPHLIFIPKQPCLACGLQNSIWRRIAKALNKKIAIYGIWLGHHQQMFDFQENGRPGFTFYTPVDMDLFKQKLRLQRNYAQTILYMNNKIAFIRLDTLEGKDYTYILRTIIKYLNTKSGQGGE